MRSFLVGLAVPFGFALALHWDSRAVAIASLAVLVCAALIGDRWVARGARGLAAAAVAAIAAVVVVSVLRQFVDWYEWPTGGHIYMSLLVALAAVPAFVATTARSRLLVAGFDATMFVMAFHPGPLVLLAAGTVIGLAARG